jgi:23S rRNA-/tRNA-specific pseudouridylate synthase
MSDENYLDWQRNPPRHTGLLRQALHCHQLHFLHPVHQTSCTMTAPLAADIEQFIQKESVTDFG